MAQRTPPQNIEAEQSILGSLMISKDAIASVLGNIHPDDFYLSRHAEQFKAILSLYQKNEAVDVVTVVDELNKLNSLDKAGGYEYIVDVLNSVPTAANVHHYVDIVKEKSVLRKMITSGTDVVAKSYEDSEESDTILNDAIKSFMDISKTNTDTDFAQIGDVVNNVWDDISESYGKEDQILGTPTGYADLDLMCSGFQPSDLIILAARPAMGKTTLAMNFALNVATQANAGVAVFSLEMPKEQLAANVVFEAKVDMSRLRTANIAEQEYRGLAKR